MAASDEAPQTPPAQTPAERLAKEYDHSAASGFDPADFPQLASDTPPAAPRGEPPAESASASDGSDSPGASSKAPPRDPQTGKFLPRGEQPPAQAQQPQHSPRLARMAAKLGILPDQVAGMSPDALEEVVELMQSQALDEARRPVRSPDWERPPERQEPPEADLGLSPEESEALHPDVQKILRKALGRYESRVARLEQHLQYQARQQAEQSAAQLMDRAVLSLKDGRFGEGTIFDVQGTPAASRRRAVAAEARQLAVARHGKDASLAQICASVPEARTNLYGPAESVTPGAGNTPPAGSANGHGKRFTEEQWAEGGLARPRSRQGAPEPKGRENAIKKVAERQREMMGQAGTEPAEGGDEEETLLP